MAKKITVYLADRKKTTKQKIVSLIKVGLIHTKYNDIGKARQVLKGLKDVEKTTDRLIVIDKSRAGIVGERRFKEDGDDESEEELLKIVLKQANDTIDTLKKEDKGIKASIEVEEI